MRELAVVQIHNYLRDRTKFDLVALIEDRLRNRVYQTVTRLEPRILAAGIREFIRQDITERHEKDNQS